MRRWKQIGAIGLATMVALALELSNQNLSRAGVAPAAVGSKEAMPQFDIFQAAILGMVQGLTEFVPISSTAHLKAIPVALGWGDPGVSFTAVIQLGSTAAVIWYFWQELVRLMKGSIKAIKTSDYLSPDFRIFLGIILGTIPIVIVGLALKLSGIYTDDNPLRSMSAIGIASIVMGLLLGVAEFVGMRKRDFGQLDAKDGILIGIAQVLALIPGVSRSGSTMTAGLFINLERACAARFSFLMGIPAIALAGIAELKDAVTEGILTNGIFPLIVGLIFSTVFSYLSIAWLLRYLQTNNNWVFVWYRLAFGVAISIATAAGRFV